MACARTRIEPRRTEEIGALTRGRLDWALVLRLAQQHGVIPLLYHQLHAVASEAIPAPVLTELRGRMVANAWRNFALTRELLALLDTLRTRGIAALPYKGPALAAMAYGSVALRQFADLDILVPQGRIAEARAALLARGYRADVRAYPPEAHASIVLFRPPATGRGTTLLFARRHLASLFERELTGRLLMITDHGLRLR